jgi:hypothetical protein
MPEGLSEEEAFRIAMGLKHACPSCPQSPLEAYQGASCFADIFSTVGGAQLSVGGGGGACPGCSSSIAGILSGSADIQLVVEDAVIMDLTHYNNKD